jgi:phospholipid/cholesterol/gamma-HCH transport system permease protein
MMELVNFIGQATLRAFASLGHGAFFFVDLLRFLPGSLRRFGLVVVQIYMIGYRSLTLIIAAGVAVGCVLALQMYYALVPFGAVESLGLVVNLSLVRELGPVVTALLFAGRAGTALTAEIGLAPRFLAGIFSMPVLAILYSAVGILGAWFIAVQLIGVDPASFWSTMQAKVDVMRDVGNGVVKAAVFGVICTGIALYQGYETQATPEGVAYATTRTVVYSSLAVLATDFILTAMMFSTS